jgi:NADH-quinone oxidoreductase subunit G
VHVVLSGSETNEIAYGLAKLVAAVGGTVQVPDADAQSLGRPLSDLAHASSVSAGDVPLEELAPVAELWAKLGKRNGASGDPIALSVPRTPNGIGVNEAVARAGANVARSSQLRSPALLVVSGDEAAADPAVRELAERAGSVLAITMFQGLAVGWADLVLPGTSYLERDGSMTNLEGRVQRVRRAVIPPSPDETAWLAKLAERFGVELSPYPSVVYEELFGESFASLGETASLRTRANPQPPSRVPGTVEAARGLRLVRYRPLFSGPAVERVDAFAFQRPVDQVDLSRPDARRLGVRDGDEVTVRTNGTSAQLRARVRKTLAEGVVLLPTDTHEELKTGPVEVTRA